MRRTSGAGLQTCAFTVRLALAAAWLAAAPCGVSDTARVVTVRDPAAVDLVDVDAGRARVMVSRGVRALTGQATDAAAWRTLVASNDVVGIKVDAEGAPLLATHLAVVDALADGLRAAGVAATNIIVWDRSAAKLAAAGFRSNDRYQVQSIPGEAGWDPDRYFESALVGKLIWGDLLYSQTGEDVSTRSHLPKLVTRTLTKLINAPVLHDHAAAGLAGCLCNLTLPVVDNERRLQILGQRGETAIPAIYAMPEIKDKVVLHVLDALVAGFAGAPAFKVRFSWPHATLYFSRDPVAIDTLALAQLERARAQANVPALGKQGAHVAAAAAAGLGVADSAQIKVEELGPEE